MVQSRIEIGVHVTISDDLSTTKRNHGAGSDMRNLRGKTFKIEGVMDTTYGKGVRMMGFTWHPNDLIEASPRKKSNIVNFNVKELVI